MGSDAHLIVVGGDPGLAASAARRIDHLERLWSRFVEDSEVNGLNRAAGSPVRVSPETALLVERALQAWRLTAGAFDPTLLGAVIRAGYDRSFDQLGTGPPPAGSALGAGAEGIEIEGDTVRIPVGSGFDAGGIGKGLAADLVAADVLAAGAEGVCVNLGGDVRVSGTGPSGDGWTVAVVHPWSAAPIACLGLAEGAVATSTTLRRRWQAGAETRHHLIDPRSGLPSSTDVNLVTVAAAQAWAAEVLAKAALLAGSGPALDVLEGAGVEGLAVDDSGRVMSTWGLEALLGGSPLPVALEPEGQELSHIPGDSSAWQSGVSGLGPRLRP
jgi:thiamine biosynthesis lipoprotein